MSSTHPAPQLALQPELGSSGGKLAASLEDPTLAERAHRKRREAEQLPVLHIPSLREGRRGRS